MGYNRDIKLVGGKNMEPKKETMYTQKLDKVNVPHHLAKLLMEQYTFAVIDGKLSLYDKTHNYWRSLRGENYDKCIRIMIPEEYKAKCNRGIINEIMLWLEAEAKEVKLNAIPKRNQYLNFRNGCINVNTYKCKKTTPELYFLHYIDADIPPLEKWEDGEIESSTYNRFINSTFSGETQELKIDFEELLGVILSPQRDLKMSSIFWGKPNTGKSVALNLISDMLNEKFVSNVSFSQFSDEFAIACLAGKTLNVSGEISGIKEKRLDLFNSVVGNDTIMTCYKGQDYFKLKNTAFLAFACNDLPLIPSEAVEAFKARIVIFPFNNQVPKQNWIYDMNAKLRGEKELISAMAIMGLKRFLKNGRCFTHQEKLDVIKERALCEINTFAAFANAKLITAQKEFTASCDIQSEYEKFCDENDLEVYASQIWSRQLRKLFPNVRKTTQKDDWGTQKRGYVGIFITDKSEIKVNIERDITEETGGRL